MKEYRSCGHLRQNVHDKPTGVPEHESQQSQGDTPGYPGAFLAPVASSRWSFQGVEPRHRSVCGTGALEHHRFDELSASHAIAMRSRKLCVGGQRHVDLVEYCEVPVCTSSCTCR